MCDAGSGLFQPKETPVLAYSSIALTEYPKLNINEDGHFKSFTDLKGENL